MKIDITKEDVLELRNELIRYAARAEQHEFPYLAFINNRIDETIEMFNQMPISELNSMFRVVYKIIGKDFTEYEL